MPRSTDKVLAALALALGLSAAVPAFAQDDTTAQDRISVNSFSGAYLAARAAEVDNDVDRAIAYYQRALSFSPTDEAIQQSLMMLLISRGDFEEALPLAEDLREVPDIERFSKLALAVDAIRSGKGEEALGLLEFEQESDLDRLITSVMRAWIEAGLGDADAALARLDGVEGPPWYALFVDYHRALIAAEAGRDDVAEQAFSAATVSLEAGGAAPEVFLRAHEAYARFRAANGDDGTSLDILAKADELAPDRVTVVALREAIEGGEEISPLVAGTEAGASEILLNLSTALNRGGGEAFVRLYLNYALALQPTSDAVLLQLGSIAEMQRKAEEAIEIYGRIAEDSPIRQVSELQVGLNLADLDRHDEAVEHLEPLLEAAPDDRRAYLALGGVYASQQKFAEAAEVYDRAVARIETPEAADWNLYYQRGIAYERIKQWDKAEPNFNQALELYPDHPQVMNYLGYSWVDMNMNLEEGLALIQKAVDLRPSDGHIVDSLGWAYYRLGRFEEAVTELERAVSLMPSDAILNDHLGDAYWKVGRRLEATFQWSHARDLEPEEDLLEEINRKLRDGLVEAAAEPEAEQDFASLATAPEVPAEPEVPAAQVATTAPVSPAPVEATHAVGPGQSLWDIARERLGDGNRYREILDLNPDLRGNPDLLRPGQTLVLPQN
ncbi:tetratricopeptide repeat protein [Aliihoeflea sp. 40Bstr573]|uniref:tetratricopeptide repeat protein n=1 Tax=Aliihoeflea sp. 40Bstr573 TaxID=2696467 RepID=UPI0020940CC8|nr:tetratricopeptide repeat protein [Aliihoeflea sp. 40Bstr573]MCO6388354.1 tetratricopeptide repeat protein [Aliihoeflea sp. 40Bstr573]